MMYHDQPCMPGNHAACWLPLDRISPRASLHFTREDESLHALMAAIRRDGLQRPVLVRRQGNGRYVIVSGNRRLMACRLLGMTHIEAEVLPALPSRCSVHALLDALASRRLHYLEEADVLRTLNEEHGMNREALAQLLGTTAQAVTLRLQLTALDEPLRVFLMDEGAPECVARALLKLPDAESRMDVAIRAVRERLCIRDVQLLAAAASRRRKLQGGASRRLSRGRVISLVRDPRPYLNAIRDIAGQMRSAGVQATLTERSMGGQLEVTVRMPVRQRRTERRQSM
ncbi:MAG: ParB/RepB/Spo0J family partition protein [Clostridia bacterium]|nr:ParB/RepB/Spo0J family partition protein [Clostridia bacterium]